MGGSRPMRASPRRKAINPTHDDPSITSGSTPGGRSGATAAGETRQWTKATCSQSCAATTGPRSGGALGDIGIHIVDFASYGSGLDVAHVFARLKTFDKAPGHKIGEYDLDANDSFTMNVDFTGGAIGTIQATRTAAGQMDQLRLRVYGETGSIEMIYDTGKSTLRACLGEDVHTATWRDVPFDPVETKYQRFVQAVRAGRTQEPSFRRAANIQKILDKALASDLSHTDEALV
jgi:predicted dehydrogenase